MTSLAEAGVVGTATLVAASCLLLAAPRTRWLRLRDAKGSLSGAELGIRAAGVGLLTGGAVVALLAAPIPIALTLPGSWAWAVRADVLGAVALVSMIWFLDGDVNRIWVLVGAGLAAGSAWVGASWVEATGAALVFPPSGVALGAAVLCALRLSPGRTARLVSKVRMSAATVDESHVLLVDTAGHILYVSDSARAALGLGARPSRWRTKREVLPKALHKFLDDTDKKKSRLRASSGRILEARMVDLGPSCRLRRAMLIQDVTGEHRGERRLVRLAHYDSLTGLANRRLFLETLKKTLESAGASSERTALFYIDLDDFKAINDSLGHAAGDAMLKALAARFRNHLKPEEVRRFGIVGDSPLMVARLAGDEFAVIAPGISDAEAAAELARLLIDVARKPMELTDRTLSPSVSIGVALFPEHGQDIETLLRHADSALYVAKSRGRQRYAWYEASLDAKAERARQLEEGMREALDRDEMRLHYQPKVDAQSGELVGFEALLRWKSAELGDVGPAEFIPVAEARGLVSKLGSWCLGEACRQLHEWSEGGLEVVPIAVNVSSAQFAESDLQRDVSDALKNHQVDPRHLELELTESLLLAEGNHVEQILRDLRAIGVRIALDDFGTGYSALSYLNRFNLDVLKMDRALLRDIEDNPSSLGIASAVVAMAHSLGLVVVAEGVDSEEQVPILREMECDQIQGFLYAPAMPADEVARFMTRKGEQSQAFGPDMSALGSRKSLPLSVGEAEDEPVLRSESVANLGASRREGRSGEGGRVLLVDDGQGSLGTVALRLNHLGIDTHYAAAIDEAHLFVAQEREAIRLIAFSPTVELALARRVMDGLAQLVGEERRCVVIGEAPDQATRQKMREAKVDWVLWAPFNDAELRYVVKSAMMLREDLVERRDVRVPVDLVANIWSGERRDVAVVSSLSPRGAFIELSEPLEEGDSLRIEMELASERFRGFARVVHTQAEDPDCPNEPSGVGVTFYGASRDEERLLRKSVGELQARYQP